MRRPDPHRSPARAPSLGTDPADRATSWGFRDRRNDALAPLQRPSVMNASRLWQRRKAELLDGSNPTSLAPQTVEPLAGGRRTGGAGGGDGGGRAGSGRQPRGGVRGATPPARGPPRAGARRPAVGLGGPGGAGGGGSGVPPGAESLDCL